MKINIKTNKNFTTQYNKVIEKYGEEFELLNGLHDTQISASNSLSEFVIDDLIRQGAKIDAFGVGENLITSATSPVIGGVYKIVADENEDASKLAFSFLDTNKNIHTTITEVVKTPKSKSEGESL